MKEQLKSIGNVLIDVRTTLSELVLFFCTLCKEFPKSIGVIELVFFGVWGFVLWHASGNLWPPLWIIWFWSAVMSIATVVIIYMIIVTIVAVVDMLANMPEP